MSSKRILPTLVFVMSPIWATLGAGASEVPAPASDTLFRNGHFKASHNSYSGYIKGRRGAIWQQLDGGVRFLELDVHHRNGGSYPSPSSHNLTSGYYVGHAWIGNEVEHRHGNPVSNELMEWLKVINRWSQENPGHAPLTIGLDIKTDLTQERDNLTLLDGHLKTAFGEKLLHAEDLDPDTATLRELEDRILVVLSGELNTRLDYHRKSDLYGDLMFVEYQKYDPYFAQELADNVFYSAHANDASWGEHWRNEGKIVRLWKYSERTDAAALVQFPATDDPYLSWYTLRSKNNGAFPAFAFANVSWGSSRRYDSGVTPQIAINKHNLLVEVHKSENKDTLWYKIGTVNTSDDSLSFAGAARYGEGVTPSVAINDSSVIVEVHKSQNHDTLWYHVGIPASGLGSISFGTSIRYDSGVTPSVAMNNTNTVVGVHKSKSHDTLWYRVGIANPHTKSIEWGPSTQYDSGVEPNIAINDEGVVVEVHKSQNEDALWCRIGRVDVSTMGVVWERNFPYQYDLGITPAVAINSSMNAVAVHQSERRDSLWYHTGVNTGTITSWNAASLYDTGVTPSVAVNDRVVVEAHKSENHDTLWYRVGTLD